MPIYKWRCKFNNTKSRIFGFGKSAQTCTLLWPAQLDTFLSTKLTQLYTLSFHFLSYPQTLTEQWTNYPQLKLLFALISVGDRHVYIALQSMHTTSNSSILWQNWDISSWTFVLSAIYKLSIILGVHVLQITITLCIADTLPIWYIVLIKHLFFLICFPNHWLQMWSLLTVWRTVQKVYALSNSVDC